MTERRLTTMIPRDNNNIVHPPTAQDGWHVVAMTQSLTTGAALASPFVVILWEREEDL
jgi:hypothetical protein